MATLSETLPAGGNAALEALVASGSFEVTHDEGALTHLLRWKRALSDGVRAETIAPLLARVAEMERVTTDRAKRPWPPMRGPGKGPWPGRPRADGR